MPTLYRHKQIGKVIIVSMAISGIVFGVVFSVEGMNYAGMGLMLVFLACLILFGTLTVEIDEERLVIRFGNGLIQKNIWLKDIASVKTVENPWWYGWGIHFTPRGWVFNVSGFDAVEIGLKSGKTFRIGTDDPVGLEQALKKLIMLS